MNTSPFSRRRFLSGKVASDQSIQVEYAGKPLESRTYCHWKVRVWLAANGVEESKQGKTDNRQPTTNNSSIGRPTAWSAIGIRAGCRVHGERRHPADWVRHPAEPSAKSMGQLNAVLRRFITETRTSNIQRRTSNFEPKKK